MHASRGNRLRNLPFLQLLGLCDLDIDLEAGYTADRRISLIDLYLHSKFHPNWKNILWMDGRPYRRTGNGH